MVEFWKAQKAEKQGRRKKLFGNLEDQRIPTLDWMRCLDNALFRGTGRWLWAFKLTESRREELKALVIKGLLTLEILCVQFPFL